MASMMIGAVAWHKALPDLLCRRLSAPCWVRRLRINIGAAGRRCSVAQRYRRVRWVPVLDAATNTPAPIMRLAGALPGAAGAGAGEARSESATNGAQAYPEVDGRAD